MSSNSTISISFKVSDGADGLKKLTVDAKELRKVMKDMFHSIKNKKPAV